MFATYAILHVIRFICLVMFWPILKVIGYGMDFKQVILCSYAGLRGAVGMSLALIVAADKNPLITEYTQDVILLHVLGVALLTLIINATTTGLLVKKLGLSRQSDIKKNILVSIIDQLEGNVDQNINVLKEKRHFNNVDWATLRTMIDMKELRGKFERYENLHLVGNIEEIGKSGHETLAQINEKIKEQKEEHVDGTPLKPGELSPSPFKLNANTPAINVEECSGTDSDEDYAAYDVSAHKHA